MFKCIVNIVSFSNVSYLQPHDIITDSLLNFSLSLLAFHSTRHSDTVVSQTLSSQLFKSNRSRPSPRALTLYQLTCRNHQHMIHPDDLPESTGNQLLIDISEMYRNTTWKLLFVKPSPPTRPSPRSKPSSPIDAAIRSISAIFPMISFITSIPPSFSPFLPRLSKRHSMHPIPSSWNRFLRTRM